MIEPSKISKEGWANLHLCYLNGAGALPNRDLTALLPEVGELIEIGEAGRCDTEVSLRDKKRLKDFLLQHHAQLERMLRKSPFTTPSLKAIIKFLEDLKELREIPFSRKPKSQWLDDLLHDVLYNEIEWVLKGRGKAWVMYGHQRTDHYIAFCERKLKIAKSIKSLIDEAKSGRRGTKEAAKTKLKEGLCKVRELDSDLASMLQEALAELIRENK